MVAVLVFSGEGTCGTWWVWLRAAQLAWGLRHLRRWLTRRRTATRPRRNPILPSRPAASSSATIRAMPSPTSNEVSKSVTAADRSERQQGAALMLTKPPVDLAGRLAGRLLQQNLPTTIVVGATPCPSVWIKALLPIDGFCLVRRRCFLSHAARRNLG